MKSFWVSFWSDDPSRWEYHGPWWVTGYRDRPGGGEDDEGQDSICAAVMAEDENAAKGVINAAHDKGHAPAEWRFVEEQSDGWDPLENAGGRFPPKEWMRWPWPLPLPSESKVKP